MANIRRERVRYGTTLPNNGVFDGELFVLVVEGSDNLLYIWNGNDNAWEEIAGDAADLLASTLTITGNLTFGSSSRVLSNTELVGVPFLQHEDTLIATGDVKQLNATPIAVMTAPGAGIFRVPEEIFVFLDHAGVDYVADAGEDLTFQKASGGDVTHQTLDGSLFQASADLLAVAYPLNADASTVNDRAANEGLEVTIASGEWITGDSPLKIRVLYRDWNLTDFEGIS